MTSETKVFIVFEIFIVFITIYLSSFFIGERDDRKQQDLSSSIYESRWNGTEDVVYERPRVDSKIVTPKSKPKKIKPKRRKSL